jgi:AcrR family transcriptional regulator
LSTKQDERAATPRKRMTSAARREVIESAAAELFAERGYQGSSIDEIARRSGVTPPVLYDHFASKLDLYRCLLEGHFADLREVWQQHFIGDDPPEQRVARSFDAWFAYIETHPFAGRMLFRDTIGDPEVDAVQRDVAARSRTAIMPLYEREPGTEKALGPAAEDGLEMIWVVMRGVLQGLAMWWYDNRHVPRGQVVATAMNSLWIGFERVQRGEVWTAESD